MVLLRRRVLAPVIATLVFLAGWWGLTVAASIPPLLLPAPPDLVEAFMLRPGYLLTQAGATLGHTLAGFAVATTVSLTLALLLALSEVLHDALWPMLVTVQVVPTVAFAPMIVIWAGYGLTAKLILVSLVSFFPITVNALRGLSSVPRELVELARCLTASRWQTLVRVRGPHALPQTFTGLRVGITLALIGAVIAELTTPNAGLGMVILRAGQAVDTPTAVVAFGLLAAIGVSCYFALVGVERLLLPWARATTT